MRRFLMIIILSFQCVSLYSDVEKVVILGGGPAGLTSAIFAGQAKLNPLVIEGEASEGQYASVYRIENFPGFPEGISGQDLNNKLMQQALIFGARLRSGQAVKVNLSVRPFHIELADGSQIDTESLIIATGASPKWLGLESEKELMGKGISANAMLDGKDFVNKEVIVVGGGDAAVEQALILTEYASKVTLVYKGSALYGSKYLQERALSNQKISCIFDAEVVSISHENLERVTGVTLNLTKEKKEIELACEGIIVSNGRKPNTDLFKGQLEMTGTGYIVTKPDTTKGSVPGVFIAGDVAQNAYRKMITSAASGCMAGIDASRHFTEKK
jgi:thioredoxin reductase (NADPH)